jgi:DSF synthase
MHPQPRPCFSHRLIKEARLFQRRLTADIDSGEIPPVDFLVLASSTPGVFNLGGDLDFFVQAIETGERHELSKYAKACIDLMFPFATGLDGRLTTISLVQGDALGGGFEAALSGDVLIAERSAKLGLPEVLFNLFPGMGAFQFLGRKIGPSKAEKLILSGRLCGAEELFEMGVVDILAEDGEGERAVYQYIKEERRHANSYRAMRAVKACCNPLDYPEFMRMVDIWVEAALRLTDRDLRMMKRLAARQSQCTAEAA